MIVFDAKRVITKGAFSLEESLESVKFLDSLESQANVQIRLYFSQSGGSLEYLGSLNSLESVENGFFWKDTFSKRPLFPNPTKKKRRLHELFREVNANFSLLPCDTSQEPNGELKKTCSDERFLFWMDFFGWIFSSEVSLARGAVSRFLPICSIPFGCGFFCLQLEASSLQWSFFTYS